MSRWPGKTWIRLTVMAVEVALLAACSRGTPGGGGLEVHNAWVRAVSVSDEGQTNTAAYMRIVNTSGSSDHLLQVLSDAARMTELHRTTIDDSGLASMSPAVTVELPARESILLEPGGLHVMLMGVGRDLVEGASVDLTLVFETAGEIGVRAEVRSF